MRMLLVLAIGVAMGVTLVPGTGNAAWKRTHAHTCRPQSPSSNVVYDETNGLQNLTGSPVIVICPYNDNDWFPRNTTNTLNVHGHKPTNVGFDQATACTKIWGALSYSCGLPWSNAAIGSWALTPNLSSWWGSAAGDFAYVKVQLQSSSSLFGFYTST